MYYIFCLLLCFHKNGFAKIFLTCVKCFTHEKMFKFFLQDDELNDSSEASEEIKNFQQLVIFSLYNIKNSIYSFFFCNKTTFDTIR